MPLRSHSDPVPNHVERARTIAAHGAATTLGAIAIRLFNQGLYREALMFAERQCRTTVLGPTPEALCTRARVLDALGDPSGALADTRKAIEIDPLFESANRLLLAMGEEEERIQAACALLAIEEDIEWVRRSLAVLLEANAKAVGSLASTPDALVGWVAWRGDPEQLVMVSGIDGLHVLQLQSRPQHPLASAFGHAASVYIPQPNPAGRAFGVTYDKEPLRIEGLRAAGARPSHGPLKRSLPGRDAPTLGREVGPDVTVIVPVYRDLRATQACLDSLEDAVKKSRIRVRVVAVNDDSPEPGMGSLLAAKNIDVVTNPKNLGFVASVNHALEHISSGDVLLLNSDTIVPPDFLDRLSDIALSTPSLGTLTPLSNNGELTSLPLPFRSNPMPSREDIEALDRIAVEKGKDRLIDLPSGIGFCLYITRACLEAVGGLSEDFHQGYCEDSYFCLQARDLGFRNVCAAGVYVGHQGTRSFQSNKRALVVRNLKRLESWYPSHREETLAFLRLDPLLNDRSQINAEDPRYDFDRLVLVRARCRESAQYYAKSLVSDGAKPLIAEIEPNGDVKVAFLNEGGETIPWSRYGPRQLDDLAARLRNFAIKRVDVLNPALAALPWIADVSQSVDLVLLEATDLLGRYGEHVLSSWEPAEPQMGEAAFRLREQLVAAAQGWCDGLERVERVVLPNPTAEQFLRGLPEGSQIRQAIGHCTIIKSDEKPCERPAETAASETTPRLGLIVIEDGTFVWQLSSALGRRFADWRNLVVVGRSSNDRHTMRAGGPVAIGAVKPEELEEVLGRHGVTHLVVLNHTPIFEHPMMDAALVTGLPAARFCWGPTREDAGTEDLYLNPRQTPHEMCDAVMAWFERAEDGRAVTPGLGN